MHRAFASSTLAVATIAAAGLIAAGLSAVREDHTSQATSRPADAAAASDYTREVQRPYAEVMEAVKKAAQEQGFRVSNVHDIAASLRKDGLDRSPVASVEVCNSKLAHQVLQADPRMASLMPCRIAVYQTGQNSTAVSMVLPSKLMTMFPPKPQVQEAATQVDNAMKAIVDAATAASRVPAGR